MIRRIIDLIPKVMNQLIYKCVCMYVCIGNENSKPIWNRFIIRQDIIETSQSGGV